MSPGIPTRLLATQSDERLLGLVRQGHERAFEALVNRYRKPLLGYCRRLRCSDARAEDVVQLALLKAWIAVREGAEVRDLKAWLYRVVHNTAVNALRDSAHDGEPLADPTQGFGSLAPRLPADESQLDRRLQVREALAEVAALPPLQREVIVRTAVAGDSHEQVASDLGITNGAVRGLLYRARTTLRTAITSLTPPQLLGWLAGRADQGGPAPERLAELAGGSGVAAVGGAAGFGGLLLKGGAVAITAATVITGAAVVQLGASPHHRDPHRLVAAAPLNGAGATGATATAQSQLQLPKTGARRGGSAGRIAHRAGSGARPGAEAHAQSGSGSGDGGVTTGGGTQRSTTRAIGRTHRGAPANAPVAPSPAPNSSQDSSPAGAGPGQSGGSSQGEAPAGSGGPVGSAAGNGSGGGSSGGAAEGGSSGGGAQPGSGSGAESGSGGSEGSSDQGSSSESSGSESSGGEPSGSLVGTVVHEVGGILEHLLH